MKNTTIITENTTVNILAVFLLNFAINSKNHPKASATTMAIIPIRLNAATKQKPATAKRAQKLNYLCLLVL